MPRASRGLHGHCFVNTKNQTKWVSTLMEQEMAHDGLQVLSPLFLQVENHKAELERCPIALSGKDGVGNLTRYKSSEYSWVSRKQLDESAGHVSALEWTGNT